MICVENLVKHYGPVRAVDGISFRVAKGEILGFLGPNGAGKTTTMRILTGYIPPSDGQVTIGGLDVFRRSLEARALVGYLPETVPLYPEMTVRDYLEFMASIRGVRDRAAAVDRVLGACGIGDAAGQIIGKLSKGYRQRVGLAQALVHDPQVLVLDEPTIGLDPRQIHAVRELIRDLGGERTIILSTHILPEVSQVCDRVMIMHRGRIIAEGSTESLTSGLQGGLRVRLELQRAEDHASEAIAALPGVRTVEGLEPGRFQIVMEPGQDVRPELAELVVRRGWGLLSMEPVSMSLEEVFLQLTTDEETSVAAQEPAEGDLVAAREYQ